MKHEQEMIGCCSALKFEHCCSMPKSGKKKKREMYLRHKRKFVVREHYTDEREGKREEVNERMQELLWCESCF